MTVLSVESPTEVVNFLVEQHERIKTLFDDALSTSGPDRDEAFLQLRRLLAIHETAEETIVHPRARQELPGGRDVVEARLAEEHQAKTVLTELESLEIDTEAFTRKLEELRDAVVEHAEHEEHDEFSQLRQELTAAELERMTRTAKLAEAIAPTRPHAGTESRLANVFTGPFAAIVDRARDAVLGYS